jgi:apolipoprotein D and lipocalin family protein
MKRLILPLLLLLAACGESYRDRDIVMTPKQDFDPARYLGEWYEIARFPVAFQRGCAATTATYGASDAETTVSVLNRCREGTVDGPVRTIAGTGEIVGPGQLEVSFFTIPLLSAPYWVLWTDDRYQTAVVGVPSGRAGWILARTPAISAQRRAEAEAVLRRAGYDTSRLLSTPQPAR